MIPFYPVACLGHMISNGRRMAVTRQCFEVLSFPVMQSTFCFPKNAWLVTAILLCWKQGRIVRKPVNANPGWYISQIITFSSFHMFLLLCFAWLLKLKTEGQTIYRLQKQNSTFSWVSLIGLWTTRPRSYAFRLA